jgi:hypothetical protein
MVLALVRKKSDYKPGENPVSLENLSTRKPTYGEKKKRREISVTDEGWNAARAAATKAGFASLSDVIELWGRGLVEVVRVEPADQEILPKE